MQRILILLLLAVLALAATPGAVERTDMVSRNNVVFFLL